MLLILLIFIPYSVAALSVELYKERKNTMNNIHSHTFDLKIMIWVMVEFRC